MKKIIGILLIIFSLNSCKNQSICSVDESNAGKQIYDLDEATCFIALKLNKKTSDLNLIRDALIAEEIYLKKNGMISENPKPKNDTKPDIELNINDLAEYALNKEKVELTKSELIEIYDTEIEYFMFIGIVNK